MPLQAAERSTFFFPPELGETQGRDVRVTALELQSIFLPRMPGTALKGSAKLLCRATLI